MDRQEFSAALLDIALGNEDCSAICEHLQQHGIPFAFYTGYTEPLERWRNVPVIRKPATRQQILDAMEHLCGLAQRAA